MKRKVAMLTLGVIGNVGVLLGFSTFYYKKRHKSFINSKALLVYSKFLALTFFVCYPIAIYEEFYAYFVPRTVTDYTRICLTLSYWLLGFVIYLNQTSNSTAICKIYNRAMTLYHQCSKNCDTLSSKDNAIMGKCAARVLLMMVGFVVINFMKFTKFFNKARTPFQWILYGYLFLPNMMVSLTSNRLYSAASFFLALIEKGNEKLRRKIEGFDGSHDARINFVKEMKMLSRNYSELHQLFMDFNKMHKKFIIQIIAFCIFNTIFELYFLYLNISIAMRNEINVNPTFILYCCTQTFLFAFEFLSLIFIYNHLKISSEECSTILHNTNMLASPSGMMLIEISREIETFSILLMHRKFEVNVCGFIVDNSLLSSIVSSITIHLIIIIQFQIEQLRKSPVDMDKWLILILNGAANETELFE